MRLSFQWAPAATNRQTSRVGGHSVTYTGHTVVVDVSDSTNDLSTYALRLILSASVISGLCRGIRAIAAVRMGQGLSHHSLTMLMFAGKNAMNSAAAASPPRRRVRVWWALGT